MNKGPIAHPAATVILLRDVGGGFEVLLIHRNPKLAFQGGVWVFPGGRIEAEDYSGAGGDVTLVARRAAVREAEEEAGIRVRPESLILLSKWTTPEGQPQRYETWFFIGCAGDTPVRVDGGETLDYRWVTPAGVLAAQREGEISIMPPTFVSLYTLSRYTSVDVLLSALEGKPPEIFTPRIRMVPGGFLSLYRGDVAYEGGDVDQPGKRHRFWGLATGWWYEWTLEGD